MHEDDVFDRLGLFLACVIGLPAVFLFLFGGAG